MSRMIQWEEATAAAAEAFRSSDEVPMRHLSPPAEYVIADDFTFVWDAQRHAYFPTENCRPGMRPEAL